MTTLSEYDRILLRRHLTQAARTYDDRARDLEMYACPSDSVVMTAISRYKAMAEEALDFAARLTGHATNG